MLNGSEYIAFFSLVGFSDCLSFCQFHDFLIVYYVISYEDEDN